MRSKERFNIIFEKYFKILSLISFIFIIYPFARSLVNILNIFSIPVILFAYSGPSLVMFFLLLLSFLIGIIPIVPIVLLAVFGYFSVSRSLRNLKCKDTSKFRKVLSIMYFVSIGETILTPFFRALLEVSRYSVTYLIYVLVLLTLSIISFISVQYYLVDRCIEEMESHERRVRYNIAYICLEVASLIGLALFVRFSLIVLIEIVIVNVIFILLHVYYVIKLLK